MTSQALRSAILASAMPLGWAFVACGPSLPGPVYYPLSATPKAAFAPVPPLAPADTELPVTEHHALSNGLSVHVVASPGATVTTATFAFSAAASRGGCSSAAAEVSWRALELALREYDPGSAVWSVVFLEDFFRVSLRLLSRDAGLVAAHLAHVLAVRPDVHQVIRARKQTLREISRRDTGQWELAQAVIEEWRAGTAYARPEEVSRVELATVLECLDLSAPARGVLAVTGGVEPAGLRIALEAALSGWPGGTTPPSPTKPPPPIALRPRLKVVNRNIGAFAAACAISGPPNSHPDYPAFSLLAHIFGRSAHGRLEQTLRGRLGLTSWTRADLRHLQDRSVLLVVTSLDSERLNEGLDALDAELDALRGLSAEELEAATRSFREYLIATLERPEMGAYELASWGIRTGQPAEFMRAWIAAIDELGSDEVRRVAGEYFRAATVAIVIVGDQGSVASQLQWSGREYELMDPYHQQRTLY